ncbi:DNA binding protein [Cinnamomum micranthum f. kanehirae]|uniref:DNA binding protein n=1 Tax=Cinnamomum micranthum f. kanehirae TaxID=337451 RepID=A0A443P6D2_9MAGN|nr:DNA binding protein [Cinnamomum micranthum f. kanehirae]
MHVSAARSFIFLFHFQYLEIIRPLKAVQLGFSLAEICRVNYSSPRLSIGFLCEELWLISPLRALSDFFARKSRRSLGIKSSLATKELKDATDLAVGRFWFDANLPFNATRSKFCQPVADGIATVGPGYKVPSYHDLRGKILGNIILEVNAFMEHYKSCWSETGCSVMADGWTDERQRTLINFLVYCAKGVMFLKLVDASPIIKKSDALFKFFDEIVLLGLTILSILSLTMMPLTKQQEEEWLKNMGLYIGQLVPPIA